MSIKVVNILRSNNRFGQLGISFKPIRRAGLESLSQRDLVALPYMPKKVTDLERLRLGLIGEGNLSPNNLVHQIFAIESEMFTAEQLSKAHEILDRIIIRVKSKLRETMTPQEKLLSVYEAIKEEGFKFEVQKDQLFVSCLLGGNLDCDASSFVVLAAAQEFGWPVTLISVPGHVFVRWKDETVTINADLGRLLPDNYYFETFPIEYLSPLDRNGIIALVFDNRGAAKAELGHYEEEIFDYNEVIRLNPKYATAFNNRGVAKAELGRFKEAILDYNEAIRLNPKDAEAFYNRGAAKRGLGLNDEAEADFRRAREMGCV